MTKNLLDLLKDLVTRVVRASAWALADLTSLRHLPYSNEISNAEKQREEVYSISERGDVFNVAMLGKAQRSHGTPTPSVF